MRLHQVPAVDHPMNQHKKYQVTIQNDGKVPSFYDLEYS